MVYLREATQATAAARGAVPHLVGLVRAVHVVSAAAAVEEDPGNGGEAVVVVLVRVRRRRFVEGQAGLETLRLERHEVAGDEVAGVDEGGRGDAVLLADDSIYS